jgi:1-phosphatidylinositol phosphodiesterase
MKPSLRTHRALHALRVILILAALCILFSLLSASAGSTKPLAPQDDAPTAWLSARAGSAVGLHDLRVVLIIPKGTDASGVTVTLSFDGANAPETVTRTLSDLTLYRTLRAGENLYTAAEGATMRVLTLTDLTDAAYTSLTLTLTKGDSTVYTATQTAEVLGDGAGLLLTPWNHSLTDWMSEIPDNRSLADLTIPGTHDSGADLDGALSQWTKCQSLSIGDQLSSGVRFLDIRLKLQEDGLNVYHGIADQELSFDEVRADCKAFLEAHPGEVILMSIKQEDENNASFPSAIATAIAKDPDLWYTTNKLPTLGDVRGKIVLIRRYAGASIGINCWDGWADNTDFTMNNGVSMKVQDYYALEKSSNLSVKWDKITTLATTAAKEDNTLCLNFTSGYTSGLFGLPNITAVSGDINPKLLSYAETLSQGGYGVFVIDFVTPEIASALIATNFPG